MQSCCSFRNSGRGVAAALDVAQISEITKVIAADTFERPIYAGNVIATVQSADAIKVISVRATSASHCSAAVMACKLAALSVRLSCSAMMSAVMLFFQEFGKRKD